MSLMHAHRVMDDDEPERVIAWVHPASEEATERVIFANEHSENGRSQWVWVRLPNGDLILGVYPQGDTYLECERDAQFPHLPGAPA